MHRVLVSAIVVNWNGASDLDVCLQSLRAQTYSDLEVFVVDNGSTDASAAVAQRYSTVRWVPLGSNLGLAAAMNEGSKLARGEYLLFLNNDMRFAPDFVAVLAKTLSDHPDAFAADAKQYDWTGAWVVHARTVLRRGFSWSSPLLAWRFDQEDVRDITPCAFGSAANLMVRRRLFDSLGGWDQNYPMGFEDVDLCFRAWARGWPTLYVPSAVCWHRVGAASGTSRGRETRLRGQTLGLLRFAAIHLPGPTALAVMGRVLGGIARDAFMLRSVVTRVLGIGDFARQIPGAIARRRFVRLGCRAAYPPVPLGLLPR